MIKTSWMTRAATGVREYWIINPRTQTVNVYDFEHEEETGQYGFEAEVPVCIYKDLGIKIAEFFMDGAT